MLFDRWLAIALTTIQLCEIFDNTACLKLAHLLKIPLILLKIDLGIKSGHQDCKISQNINFSNLRVATHHFSDKLITRTPNKVKPNKKGK
jgi:hypothetical protein